MYSTPYSFAWNRRLLVALAGAVLVGCVSIPSEAPELSSELGVRISAFEEANAALLTRFFDQKRANVDRFIREEFAPAFISDLLSTKAGKDAMSSIVKDIERGDTEDLSIFVFKIQSEIDSMRSEMFNALNQVEQRMQSRLRADYADARAMNNTLTSFLASASEVVANRNRYLAMIGVSEEELSGSLDTIDTIANELINVVGKSGYAEKLAELANFGKE